MTLKFWRSSTAQVMGELLLTIPHLGDARYLKIVCLDSDMANSHIEDFIQAIGYSDSHPSDMLEVTVPLLQRLTRAMTGYDEVWFFPTVNKVEQQEIVPLQSVSAEWDLSVEHAPNSVVQSARRNGASLIISDCGRRNLIYFGCSPPSIVGDLQWGTENNSE